MARSRDERSKNICSIPDKGKQFSSILKPPFWLWGPSSLLLIVGLELFSREWGGREWNWLPAFSDGVKKVRVHMSIATLRRYVFMVSTGKTLPEFLKNRSYINGHKIWKYIDSFEKFWWKLLYGIAGSSWNDDFKVTVEGVMGNGLVPSGPD